MADESYAKGASVLLVAQIINIVSSFALQVLLGIVLGPSVYGIYGAVISLVSLSALLVMSGVSPCVSKFISEDPSVAGVLKRMAVQVQLIFAGVITLAYVLGAPFLASLLRDPSLTPFIQIAAISLLPRSLQSVYEMYFNGLHAFHKHAYSWSIFNISKLVLSVLFGYLFSLTGAIIAFTLAPCLSAVYGFFASKEHGQESTGTKKHFPLRLLLNFSFYASLFFLLSSAIQSLDLLMVKSLLRDNLLTGYYNAASSLAKIPFFMIIALTLVVFPAVSRNTSKVKRERLRRIVNDAIRYSMVLVFPIAGLVSAQSTQILTLFYTSKYIAAGPTFAVLIIGTSLFTILYLCGNILVAAGMPKKATLLMVCAVVVDYLLLRVLIMRSGLMGAALGTVCASAIMVLVGLILIYLVLGATVNLWSLLRISLASAAVSLAAKALPSSKVMVVAGLMVLVGVYFVLLVLLKEISRKEIEQLIAAVRKKG